MMIDPLTVQGGYETWFGVPTANDRGRFAYSSRARWFKAVTPIGYARGLTGSSVFPMRITNPRPRLLEQPSSVFIRGTCRAPASRGDLDVCHAVIGSVVRQPAVAGLVVCHRPLCDLHAEQACRGAVITRRGTSSRTNSRYRSFPTGRCRSRAQRRRSRR